MRPLSLPNNFKYKQYWRKSALKNGFDQIFIDLIKEKKPKTFLEIGVFTGVTARNVCELLSLINHNNFLYYGIDLFEDYQEAISKEFIPKFLSENQNFSNPLKSFIYNFLLKEKLNSLNSVSKFLILFVMKILDY